MELTVQLHFNQMHALQLDAGECVLSALRSSELSLKPMAILSTELNDVIRYFQLEWDLVASFACSHGSGDTPTTVKRQLAAILTRVGSR